MARPASDNKISDVVAEAQWHLANATVDHSQFITGIAEGAAVPDARVFTPEGSETRLSALWSKRPALVITGSMTCPPSRVRNPASNILLEKFSERLNVAVLYVLDAHPDGDACPYTGTDWVTATNREEGVLIRQPRDQAERNRRAAEYRARLGLAAPVLVDNMANDAWAAVGKAPNTAVLIGADGTCLACQKWYQPEDLLPLLAEKLGG